MRMTECCVKRDRYVESFSFQHTESTTKRESAYSRAKVQIYSGILNNGNARNVRICTGKSEKFWKSASVYFEGIVKMVIKMWWIKKQLLLNTINSNVIGLFHRFKNRSFNVNLKIVLYINLTVKQLIINKAKLLSN